MDLAEDEKEFSRYAYGTLSVTMFSIMLAALITNVLVALVIAKKWQQRSNSSNMGSNKLVLNLCVTNSVLPVVVLPFVLVSTIERKWIFGDAWCKASGFITILLSTNSLLTAMILSYDLYHCIVNPLTYQQRMTPAKTTVLLIYTWFQSVFTAILPLVGWGKYGYQEHKYSCSVLWNNAVSEGYVKLYVATAFVLPFALTSWAYYHIVKAAKRQARILPIRNVPFRGSISSTVSSNFTGSKALRTTLLVLGSLLLCWGTFNVTIILESTKIRRPYGLEVTSMVLSFFVSFLYPLIYGIRIKKTRRRIRRLLLSLCCCGCDNNVRPFTSSDTGFWIDSTRAFRSRSVSDGSVLDFEGARTDEPEAWCLPVIVEETDSHHRTTTEITDLDRLNFSIPGQIPE